MWKGHQWAFCSTGQEAFGYEPVVQAVLLPFRSGLKVAVVRFLLASPKIPWRRNSQKTGFVESHFFGKNRGLYDLQFSDFWRGPVLLQGLSGNLAVVVAESKTPILTACPAAYASGNKLHFQAAVAAETMKNRAPQTGAAHFPSIFQMLLLLVLWKGNAFLGTV